MARRAALFFSLAAIAYFVAAGSVGLIGPDEPRYAEIMKEMRADPLVPRLWGEPWFEKPVLAYWVGIASSLVFGMGETAWRAGSLASALLLGIFLYRLIGGSRGMLAASMLVASPMWIGYAHGASPDMLFASTFAASILMSHRWIEGNRRACLYAYALLALAFLAKGPVGPLLFALVVGTYALYRRRARDLASGTHLRGLMVFVAIGSPWYLYISLTQASFFQEFFVNHNIHRYTTEVYQHTQPPAFYLGVLALGVLPFTVLFLSLRPPKDTRSVLSAIAVAWPTIFFTLSRTKLPGYVLPCIPFLCILVSGMPTDRLYSRLALLVVQLCGSAYLVWRLHGIGVPEIHLLLICIPFVAAAALFGVPRIPIPVGATAMMIGFLMLKIVGGSFLDRSYSTRPMERELAGRCDLGDLVLFTEDRSTVYGLSYYAGRDLSDTSAPGVVFRINPKNVLTTPAGLALLRSFGSRTFTPCWNYGDHLLVAVTP